MSQTEPASERATVRQYSGMDDVRYADDSGAGWVAFAGVMLALLAVLNMIDGIAAVSNSTFFVGDAKYVFADLNTWGWILIGVGVVQAVTAFGVWARWTAVRWIGVLIASLNAIAQMLMMPAYPFWSLALFAVDVLVIYALIAHGGRRV
jgi:hypothetical protein